MAGSHQETLSINEIRILLVSAIKDWEQLTSNLTWPEGDDSMADMDTHVLSMKAVKGNLALIETKLPPVKQQTLAAHFRAGSVQDPEQFAPFAAAVKHAMAA